ncbi:MAG: hypothetical protein RI902_495 [Pseudomonadota bacterium]
MYVEIEAPEIQEYGQGFPRFWLKSIFIASVSTQYQVNALASTYVRLVESAIVEYNLGVSRLQEFWSTHTSLNLGAMHRSGSHFETCLSNMYRATNCFRKLRRSRDALAIALNTDRPAFASDAVAGRFKDMRNDIHHMEELVLDGRIKEGDSFALRPDGPETPHPSETGQTIKRIDRLVIGVREIQFSELSTWLKEMAGVAEKIAAYGPDSTPRNVGDAG